MSVVRALAAQARSTVFLSLTASFIISSFLPHTIEHVHISTYSQLKQEALNHLFSNAHGSGYIDSRQPFVLSRKFLEYYRLAYVAYVVSK